MKIATVDFGEDEKRYGNMYPWKQGDVVLVLGEIENMPSHYAVVTTDGKTHFGYHETFFVYDEDEMIEV
jgi:hypothetical protein